MIASNPFPPLWTGGMWRGAEMGAGPIVANPAGLTKRQQVLLAIAHSVATEGKIGRDAIRLMTEHRVSRQAAMKAAQRGYEAYQQMQGGKPFGEILLPRANIAYPNPWATYAGGTSAAPGKYSYQIEPKPGVVYDIAPITTRYGRHAGYRLWIADPTGKSGSGLWHDLGTFRSPQAAKGAAKRHALEVSHGVLKNPHRRLITVDMLEQGKLVVRHQFPDQHMLKAHVKADASLRAALEGRKYKGVEIEAVRHNRELTVPEKHQLRIARDTLKMPPQLAAVMGGPSISEAKEIIRRLEAAQRESNPLTRKESGEILKATRTSLHSARRLAGATAPERQDPVTAARFSGWWRGRADALRSVVAAFGGSQRVQRGAKKLAWYTGPRGPMRTTHPVRMVGRNPLPVGLLHFADDLAAVRGFAQNPREGLVKIYDRVEEIKARGHVDDAPSQGFVHPFKHGGPIYGVETPGPVHLQHGDLVVRRRRVG